jgi:hypothetical protein
MAQRSLSLTKVVRLSSGELSQVKENPTPWILGSLAGLLLIGVAWWTVAKSKD